MRLLRCVRAWMFAGLALLSLAAHAQNATAQPAPFKPEELEALVAPIALYPDSVLSQVLMASTYPLEIVQAARWVKANPAVKGDAALKAVESQPWDVSVKSLVAFPQALEPMSDKLDWTQKLGDAFLAQEKELLAAVQRLRARAQQSGSLKSVCDAQNEYAQIMRKADGVTAYATKLVSSPGKRDGLYWPTQSAEPASPLGPAFIEAERRRATGGRYHGYRYRLLTSQGAHAPGGKYDYVVNGKLIGGFAVIAWPLRYGNTGIKSFMVSHDGRVFERDLGPDSAARVAAIKSYDQGPGWTEVTP